MKKTTFTYHAFDQVAKRLHLSHEEVAQILDFEKTIPIGLELRSRRMHILFYSDTDHECFVAVRDEKTREVITILPSNFDRHCKVPLSAITELTPLRHQEEVKLI